MKYVIVGGVAGGATAAARLRRLDEKAEIVMFERGDYISYANCGLPYYLGGVISDRDNLFVQNPQKFYQFFNVEVRTQTEVMEIDREKKRVQWVKNPGGQTGWESYDKLLLSPGADPVKPPAVGTDTPGIFTLRNVVDTDRIYQYIAQRKPKRAIIVGAGFIGLEVAENLHHRGIFTTIVEMASQVMVMLDFEMASLIHQHLKSKGVEFYLGDGVASIQPGETTHKLQLNSGRTLETDLLIFSVGVRPETALAQRAGLTIGAVKGIWVNEYLQTSDPNIYAVGDAIEFTNPITGKPTITYLAGPANKQGRIAAENMVSGNKRLYKGSIATAVAKVFDLTAASTGVSEKVLQREKIEYLSAIIHSSSHAGYYPGALPLTLKILFSKEGKIFGAQGVGYEGVDKRIDLIASVLRHGGTIEDLADIEHAYAPPYSSARDPVHLLAYAAENILRGLSHHVRWDELDPAKHFILDVRTHEEFSLGSIPQAVNIPLQEIRKRLNELPRDRHIVCYCGVGLRAYMVERILKQHGFNASNLSGGYKIWESVHQKQGNEDIWSKFTIEKDNMLLEKTSGPATTPPGGITFKEVDACGLQCPGPIQKLKQTMDTLKPGEKIKIRATDPGFARDAEAWAKMTGNLILSLDTSGPVHEAVIEKGMPLPKNAPLSSRDGDTTLILFSQDMDKALASLVIANGAASSGKKVTIFFTFWGLNLLKKRKKPRVKKDLMGRMFGMMLPKHLGQFKLSRLNMGGLGTWMMKLRMKMLGIPSLEEMFQQAQQQGVRLVACQMSMDVMGVKKEELLDGVELGGVATFLEAADTARATLFM
jgi:NADPH-dependent 2,4-dienoyl-CoA reductase/sulfur reductase-like enzyme/peroxiredoxin family protein/rhodanese-related sulfurtransferase/TusA-related sulfurtransferase